MWNKTDNDLTTNSFLFCMQGTIEWWLQQFITVLSNISGDIYVIIATNGHKQSIIIINYYTKKNKNNKDKSSMK